MGWRYFCIWWKIYKKLYWRNWFFLEVDVKNPEKLNNVHNDLPFLLERMKIEKVEKLVAIFYDKIEYVIHIRNLKQALNHGLVLKRYIEWLTLIKMFD